MWLTAEKNSNTCLKIHFFADETNLKALLKLLSVQKKFGKQKQTRNKKKLEKNCLLIAEVLKKLKCKKRLEMRFSYERRLK